MPFFVLFLLLTLLPFSLSQLTYDSCRSSSNCVSPRTCRTTQGAVCGSQDPLCFCLPPKPQSCPCSNPNESCAQDANLEVFCAANSAISRFSFLAPAPVISVSPGALSLESCQLDNQCKGDAICTLLTDAGAPCLGRTNCVCLNMEPSFCLKKGDCGPGEVCGEAIAVLPVPFCVSNKAASDWIGVKEVGLGVSDGLAFEPCKKNAGCIRPRVCRQLLDVNKPCEGGVCFCVWENLDDIGSCDSTGECKNRGEICARNPFYNGGGICSSLRVRDEYSFLNQVNRMDVCPVLIQVDDPRAGSRMVRWERKMKGWGRVSRMVSTKDWGNRMVAAKDWQKWNTGQLTGSAENELDLDHEVRIVGGLPATRNLRSFMALVTGQGGKGVCSAVLIGPEWIMFAAHCEVKVGSNVAIGGKQFSFSNQQFVTTLKRVIVHPQYERGLSSSFYDVAVGELDKKAPETARSMKLNAAPARPMDGSAVRVVGYGRDGMRTAKIDILRLRQLDLTVVSTAVCNVKYRKATERVTIKPKLQVCAHSPRERCGPCFGDSGGPLIQYQSGVPILLGITSASVFSGLCDTVMFPAVFTRVTGILPWLRSTGILFSRSTVTCAAGEFYREEKRRCIPCAIDEKSQGGRSRKCIKCSRGFVRDSEDGARCGCIGMNATGRGIIDMYCKKCPPGMFSGVDDGTCRDCPAGMGSEAGATRCT